MKRTRTELIKAGAIWQVSPANDPDTVTFEGSQAACRRFLKPKGRKWYREFSLGQVIWEKGM